MKIAHTADIHLGATSYLPDAFSRQVNALRWFFKKALSFQPDLIVISGDVFHPHQNPPQEAKDAFLRLILRFEKANVPVVVIEGNHSPSATYTHLDTYAYLEKKGKIKNFYFATTRHRHIDFGDFSALLIPYGLDYEVILDRYRAKAAVKPTVAVLHELFDGADVNGKIVKSKKKLPCYPEYYYYALGDVHHVGNLPSCPKAWYSGSLIQHTVGESFKKGFLLVDGDPTQPKFIRTPRKVAWPILKVKQGEPIPEDAYVIYYGEPSDDLPDNVIEVRVPKVKSDLSAKVVAQTLTLETVLQALKEEMEESGFDEEAIQERLEVAEKILAKYF